MFVSTEVLALFLIGVVLLVAAVGTQIRAERRLKLKLRDAEQHVYLSPTPDGDAPDPGPHDHVWSSRPTEVRGGWRLHACTIPGCRAEPNCRTGRA